MTEKDTFTQWVDTLGGELKERVLKITHTYDNLSRKDVEDGGTGPVEDAIQAVTLLRQYDRGNIDDPHGEKRQGFVKKITDFTDNG